MKTLKFIIMGGALLAAGGLHAQTAYDAARFTGSELNGTARFVGMGGAMSALGGDISVMSTNPAGIGIYRSNDVALSFGFNNTRAESSFNGTFMNRNKSRGSFDQVGFVYSTKIGNHTPLRYVNFGFNYHKSKNFNRAFEMGGNLDGFSQSYQIAGVLSDNIADEQDFADLLDADNPYTDSNWRNVSTLAKMAGRTGVVDWFNGAPEGLDGLANNYYSRETGGINQYDFNVSFNFYDRFYLGATLGVYDVNYDRYSSYSESFDTGISSDGYTLENWFHTEGTGIDLKLGAIVLPFEDSPFRVGVAVHTPTWYNLTDVYSAYMAASINAIDSEKVFEEDTYGAMGRDYVSDYQLNTPWKFNVSMGTTLSGIMAVGAEYEYSDYSSAKFKTPDGSDIVVSNEEIDYNLKGVHTLRLGMETRVSPAFSVRAGYNYSTAVFNQGDDVYKYLVPDDTRTDTEYENQKDRHTFAVGLGYRGKLIYADLAYKCDLYKSNFYAFTDMMEVSGSNVYLPATKVDNTRHQLLLTIGARF